jgi:hypothetical protein
MARSDDDRPDDRDDVQRDEALREGWREPHNARRGEDQ